MRFSQPKYDLTLNSISRKFEGSLTALGWIKETWSYYFNWSGTIKLLQPSFIYPSRALGGSWKNGFKYSGVGISVNELQIMWKSWNISPVDHPRCKIQRSSSGPSSAKKARKLWPRDGTL